MTVGRSMRAELCTVLGELAREMPDLMAVSADGHLIFRDFIKHAPERHVDVGIAEATLVGVAAGIARCGRPVIVSSIASFLLRRAYEQIVIDVCFDCLPVKLIGIGGGLAYGTLGPTHHIPEDVSLMRSQPAMEILIPADAAGAAQALWTAVRRPGPAYIRIGSGDDPVLPNSPGGSPLEPRLMRDGTDLTILASGICVHEALAAAADLEHHGANVRVVAVACLRPWPKEAVLALLLENRPVLTVEEHLRDGALGSLVAESLEGDSSRPLSRLAIDHRSAPAATREELLAFYGVDRAAISRSACDLLRRGKTHAGTPARRT